MKIKEILVEMLTENTGVHMLDSGGANGRQWQRNQGVDFEAEPMVEFDDEYPTVSVYHYLSEILDNDEESDAMNVLLKNGRELGEDLHWVQDCIDVIEVNYNIENISQTFNTYNGECFLSQTLLYLTFTLYGEPYILLQIHGGADVRGGYTDTKVFKLVGYLEHTPTVYGTLTKANGDEIEVESSYCGYKMTEENGDEIEFEDGDKIEGDFCVIDDTYMYGTV